MTDSQDNFRKTLLTGIRVMTLAGAFCVAHGGYRAVRDAVSAPPPCDTALQPKNVQACEKPFPREGMGGFDEAMVGMMLLTPAAGVWYQRKVHEAMKKG